MNGAGVDADDTPLSDDDDDDDRRTGRDEEEEDELVNDDYSYDERNGRAGPFRPHPHQHSQPPAHLQHLNRLQHHDGRGILPPTSSSRSSLPESSAREQGRDEDDDYEEEGASARNPDAYGAQSRKVYDRAPYSYARRSPSSRQSPSPSRSRSRSPLTHQLQYPNSQPLSRAPSPPSNTKASLLASYASSSVRTTSAEDLGSPTVSVLGKRRSPPSVLESERRPRHAHPGPGSHLGNGSELNGSGRRSPGSEDAVAGAVNAAPSSTSDGDSPNPAGRADTPPASGNGEMSASAAATTAPTLRSPPRLAGRERERERERERDVVMAE